MTMDRHPGSPSPNPTSEEERALLERCRELFVTYGENIEWALQGDCPVCIGGIRNHRKGCKLSEFLEDLNSLLDSD